MQLILKPWRLKITKVYFLLVRSSMLLGTLEVTTFSGHGPLDIAQV